MKDKKMVPPSANQRNVFFRRLVLSVLLVDLFIILHAVWSLDKSRNLYEERTAVETGNLARVLEEFIENSMEKVEIALLAVVEEAENQLSSGGIDGRKLRRLMVRLSGRLPELASLRMVNEKGYIVYGTDIPEGVIKNIADREYFRLAKNNKQVGLVISSPLVSRVSGKLVIVFARRLNHPDGSFAGIASAAVPVEYFLSFFSSVDIGKHGVIVLRDEKLGILIRYPEPKDAGSLIGRRSVSRQLSNLLERGRKSGTFNAPSPVDGVVRKLSIRRFSDFPLYILVGIAEDEYLSKWWNDVREIAASVIISVLLSIIFSRLVYSYWIRKKDAYLALSRQEEKFRTVADYTENWEFWMGPDGEFVYTSPSCEKVTGYDAKAFYSDTGLKERIIHPDDRKLFDGHAHGSDSGSVTKSLTFRINHADGSTRWIEHICRSIFDENGVFQGTRGSNRDITRRRETEEALKRSEEQFRTIFNSSADPIIMRDQSFRIVEVNDIACELLGYSRNDFLRMDYLDVICERDPGRLMELLEKIHSAGQVTYESGLKTANGREIPVEISARMIDFEGRSLILSISRDITERKKAERRLAELNDCFLKFGMDSDRNIDFLVELCGRELGAACAAYSRFEGGELRPGSTWNTPADFGSAPLSSGSVCYNVFRGSREKVAVIQDLQQTRYAETDPKISKYGIKTYAGRTVSFSGTDSGLLCAVYLDDRAPGEEDKKLLGIIAAAIGVEEERRRGLTALRESEATLRSITGSARDAIIMISARGTISFWNDTASRMFGWNESQALGRDLHAMIMPDRYREAFSAGINRFATTGTGNAIGKTLELQAMHSDGSEIPVEVSLSAVQIKGEWNAVGIIRDITERKHAEAEIEHIAYHDALTGLPNRLLLDDRLGQAIAHAARSGHITGVLFFDLDNFKSVNDSLGHPVGDMLIKEVVERLGDRLRKSDSMARMGGDEFIIVLMEIATPEDAAHAARFFLEAFSEPFQLVGQEIYTSASVGISLYPIDGTSTATLIKNADIAMYQAKKHGRNSFQFYTEEINRRAEERLILENELRHAVNRDEFILLYQPCVDLLSGTIGGMEALIRWIHPQRGVISPARFIPIAEETGLIVPIGEWVMKTACRFLGELHRKGLSRLTMCVNVSGKQLLNPNLIGLLGLLLADADFEPSLLELELTESSVMENVEESRKYMEALKMLGVRLALDDFGTGYSSLSYLKRFPLDRLKIDRSFVKDCPDNPDDVAIARSVIALARSLNLQVTAEGVETMAQADFFSREKCDMIQGNLISVPMPANRLMQLLTG